MSPKITFLPMNQTFDVKDGETVLEAAIAHDIPIMHACGGFCACTTCHVKVIQGDGLTAVESDEEERLDAADQVALNSRLGCQAKVKGDVTVEIVNLDV